MRLLLAAILLATWSSITAQSEDATSLIQSILDVDRALAQEIKNDITLAKEKQDALRNQFSQNLNNSVQRLKDALNSRLEKLRQIEQAYEAEELSQKQKTLDEWKNLLKDINNTKVAVQQEKEKKAQQQEQQIRQLLDQLKAAYQKRKEQKAAENQKEKEQLAQAWQKAKAKVEQIQAKINQSSTAQKERRKEMLANMKTTLDEIKAIINQAKTARDQQQQQIREDYQNKINSIKSDIAARKDDLDAREEELREKFALFKEKQNEFKSSVQNALKDSVKASVVMELGDKLQNTLDQEALKQAFSQNEAKRKEALAAAPKATVLDEITGVSAWQTVTWILLALCILLCIALIAMIIYQLSQRNKYHRLAGDDHPDERTPIAQPVAPAYTEEKALVPAPSSAPTVPYGETQQF